MNMKRMSVIMLLIITSASIINSEDEPRFYLSWSFQISPWFYESVYETNNISLNTQALFGLDYSGFSIGIEPFCDYTSLKGQDPSRLLEGAWINFGTSLDANFRPANWMDIALGAGGLFQRSLFQYNNSGWLGLNRWGVTAICDLKIIPMDSLDFVIKNRFDLIFAFDGSSPASVVLPNYSGGLRVDVHPGLDWLALFIEADAFYWDYSSEVRSVQSWMFQAQVGFTLDLRLSQNTSEKVPIEKIEPGLLIFSQLKPGIEASFSAIVFEPGKVTLEGESIQVLGRIADILLANKNVAISIEAYAEYSGNPLLDSELISGRAETIKTYLLSKGVEDSRIKVSSMGRIVNTNSAVSEKPNVILKILSN